MSETGIEILIKEVMKQNSACSHCRIKFLKKMQSKKNKNKKQCAGRGKSKKEGGRSGA
jgi:hypothetical protein